MINPGLKNALNKAGHGGASPAVGPGGKKVNTFKNIAIGAGLEALGLGSLHQLFKQYKKMKADDAAANAGKS